MRTSGVIIVLILVTVLAACSSGNEDPRVSTGTFEAGGSAATAGGGITTSAIGPGISIGEAIASPLEGALLVNGYVVASGGAVRLCELIDGGSPPVCGGASVAVAGLDLAALEGLTRDAGVTWTEQPIQLLGEVERGTLTVSSNVSG